MSIIEKFRDFEAGKATLFWSCAACSIATMVVGFTWGGWVTGGSAQERADIAAGQATASLAADVCVQRYLEAPQSRVSLTALIDQSAYSRRGTIEDGGWVTLGDRETPVVGAGILCAQRLAEIDLATLPETSTEGSSISDLTPTSIQ